VLCVIFKSIFLSSSILLRFFCSAVIFQGFSIGFLSHFEQLSCVFHKSCWNSINILASEHVCAILYRFVLAFASHPVFLSQFSSNNRRHNSFYVSSNINSFTSPHQHHTIFCSLSQLHSNVLNPAALYILYDDDDDDTMNY
jgi:hypothetical protein